VRSLPKTLLALAGSFALASLGLLAATAPAEAAAVCAFDQPTGVVTVTLAASETALISRLGDGTITLDAVACDVATVTNTDTVLVSGAGPADEVTIDLSGGPFAPGLTAETDGGTSEIEFIADLGGGSPPGKLHVTAGTGPDRITVGSGGINLNADEAVADSDVAVPSSVFIDVDGGSGDDVLSVAGGAGTGSAASGVSLKGGDGDDILAGANGGDDLSGDNGTDTADYSAATDVKIDDLNIGIATLGGGGQDQLTAIEDLTGSPGDDKLVGDGGPNVILGGGGNDVLDGSGGDDILDGGAGNDTADFGNALQGVTVDLTDGTASGAGVDTLFSIENAYGTLFADTIDGSDGPNVITGRNAGDIIYGHGGRDDISGSHGADFLVGGDGGDTIKGGPGKDELDGGNGHDVCAGGPDPDSWVNCED
jgi:Ca2+-binding RTX toxin-like protein